MAVNDIFRKVPIEVPNKSGFDMTNEVLSTMTVGTLVPIHTDLLLPNDTVSLGVSAEIQLPPMATDFYGRVKAHFETFFVPCRQLYGGWQELITHPVTGDVWPSGTSVNQKAKYLPTLRIPVDKMGPGSLSDYLGYGMATASAPSDNTVDVLNPLKYLAYHKVWTDFYRDSRTQQPAFSRPPINGVSAQVDPTFSYLPYSTHYADTPYLLRDVASSSFYGLRCADGVECYDLRQRCFGKDYFTNGTPLPQAGQPASVAFGVENNQGAFSIASLRAANALQIWMERMGVAGYRYGDQIRAQFGIYPADAALDRPLYLGRQIVDVYNKSVFQSDGDTAQTNSNNPFSTVGSKYGSPLGVGSGSLCDSFTASEHGYLMTIFSLVPDSIYSDVLDKDFWYNKMSDFPFPLLQGVGDEPISLAELIGYKASAQNIGLPNDVLEQMKEGVFAYTQRYASHKFKLDRVHGLLKDNESLQSFALQRSFDWQSGSPGSFSFGSDFLEIPTNYLDNVAAVQGDVSKYGCWCDLSFAYKKVSTLAAYSIPTLGDPKNTHTEVIENGGTRL